MKRNFILVFILLVTLSTVNAIPHQLLRRVTTFQPCPDGQGAPLNVIVTPDPPKAGDTASFDVSGNANEDINDDAIMAIGFVDLSSDQPKLVGEPFVQQICSGIKCPVRSGTSFEAKAEQVPVPKVTEPFGIVVGVGSPKNNAPSNCALAVVGGSGGSPGGGSGGGGSGGPPGGGSGGSGSPDGGSPGGPPPSAGGSPGGGPGGPGGGPTFLWAAVFV